MHLFCENACKIILYSQCIFFVKTLAKFFLIVWLMIPVWESNFVSLKIVLPSLTGSLSSEGGVKSNKMTNHF
jgi:hypothetical protein